MSDAPRDERSRLLRALALSERFHLYLGDCENPRAADAFVAMLGADLAVARDEPVLVVRLDPYADVREPLREDALVASIVVPILDPSAARSARGVVHVVDASRARGADVPAWARAFSLWNEKRNAMQQRLGGEVVVLLPRLLRGVFSAQAPDVWSVRSGEYAVPDPVGLEHEESVGATAADASASRFLGRASPFRTLPPLALFGGPLVISPWIEELFLWGAFADPVVADDASPVRLRALRERRSAEAKLAAGQFDVARRAYAELLENPHVERSPILVAGMGVALAMCDRPRDAMVFSDEALEAAGSPPWEARDVTRWAVCASALTRWCAGDLRRARNLEWYDDIRARSLRRVELGELEQANRELGREAGRGTSADLIALMSGDVSFTRGELDDARAHLERALAGDRATDAGSLLALVEVLRGDIARAGSLLTTPSKDRDARGRAFADYVAVVRSLAVGDRAAAANRLEVARGHVAEWGRTGFDRRSLHRAEAALELIALRLAPVGEDASDRARKLTETTLELLGDTGDDCVARALAVHARLDHAARLAEAGDDAAAELNALASELAKPLVGRGAPAWDALAREADRAGVRPSRA